MVNDSHDRWCLLCRGRWSRERCEEYVRDSSERLQIARSLIDDWVKQQAGRKARSRSAPPCPCRDCGQWTEVPRRPQSRSAMLIDDAWLSRCSCGYEWSIWETGGLAVDRGIQS